MECRDKELRARRVDYMVISAYASRMVASCSSDQVFRRENIDLRQNANEKKWLFTIFKCEYINARALIFYQIKIIRQNMHFLRGNIALLRGGTVEFFPPFT